MPVLGAIWATLNCRVWFLSRFLGFEVYSNFIPDCEKLFNLHTSWVLWITEHDCNLIQPRRDIVSLLLPLPVLQLSLRMPTPCPWHQGRGKRDTAKELGAENDLLHHHFLDYCISQQCLLMTVSITITTARGSGKIWRKENHKQNILYEKFCLFLWN